MTNKLYQLNRSQKFSIFIVLFLVLRTLNITINETLVLSLSMSLLLKLILVLSFAVIDFLIFFQLNKIGRISFLIIEAVTFLLLMLTSFRYPTIGLSVVNSYGWLIIAFIPIMISLFYVEEKNLYVCLHKSSYIITILCTLIYFFHVRKLSTNLVFSYTLLLPYLIHINEFIKRKNILVLIITLFESYMLLTYGSRGTLVCAILFIVLYFLKLIGLKNIKYFIIICLILIGIYEVLYFTGFFESVYNYFLEEGKYIRILDLISKGEFFSNNGRFDIYSNYVEYILDKPILGWGIGADLFIGIFPHNLLIEVIFNFGLIIGIILILLIIVLIIQNVKNNRSVLFLILFCSGVLPLFFSFSYLEWMNFWIFVGYLMTTNKNYIKNHLQRLKISIRNKK